MKQNDFNRLKVTVSLLVATGLMITGCSGDKKEKKQQFAKTEVIADQDATAIPKATETEKASSQPHEGKGETLPAEDHSLAAAGKGEDNPAAMEKESKESDGKGGGDLADNPDIIKPRISCRYLDPSKVNLEIIKGAAPIAINVNEYVAGRQPVNGMLRFEFTAYLDKCRGSVWRLEFDGQSCMFPHKYTAYILNAELELCTIEATLDSTDRRTRLGCFADTVKIKMADGSDRPIGLIKVGDEVLNPVTGRSQKIAEMIKGPEAAGMIEVGYGSHTVLVTQKHPFLTPQGLKAAQDLATGEEILDETGSYVPLTVARLLPAQSNQVVYNIRLDSSSSDPKDHMVLADGIVTGDLLLQRALEATLP
jgi:hypothetical protein